MPTLLAIPFVLTMMVSMPMILQERLSKTYFPPTTLVVVKDSVIEDPLQLTAKVGQSLPGTEALYYCN